MAHVSCYRNVAPYTGTTPPPRGCPCDQPEYSQQYLVALEWQHQSTIPCGISGFAGGTTRPSLRAMWSKLTAPLCQTWQMPVRGTDVNGSPCIGHENQAKKNTAREFAKNLLLCWISKCSSCIWYCFDAFFFLSLTKNMCNFLSETPVLECVEQIFYKRGKVRLRVILLSSDFLELRAKTGNSPKEVLYCLKELKSHTAHFALGLGDKDGSRVLPVK